MTLRVDRICLVSLLLPVVISASLVMSCTKSENPTGKPTARPESLAKPSTPAATVTGSDGPGKDQQACFECAAQGTIACRAPGCIKGKVDCPAPCLKLTRGTWIHMNVPAHDPSELWQKFPDSKGKGSQAWNQNHVGEVVVMQNGQAVNTGRCQTCGGSTKVQCAACKGQGKQPCVVCEGKRYIPLAWKPTDNPWFNKQPDLIRLKDGRVFLGKVAAANGDDLIVRLRDGKIVHVSKPDIQQ